MSVGALLQLIAAWKVGEDCHFAITDMLLEMGYPKTAEQHKLCVPNLACGLVWAETYYKSTLPRVEAMESWLQLSECHLRSAFS